MVAEEDCSMNRQMILIRLAKADCRISNSRARIAVLTDTMIIVSGTTLLQAAAELRGARDALKAMRLYQSILLKRLAEDDAQEPAGSSLTRRAEIH